jgi:hypothetical protein
MLAAGNNLPFRGRRLATERGDEWKIDTDALMPSFRSGTGQVDAVPASFVAEDSNLHATELQCRHESGSTKRRLRSNTE